MRLSILFILSLLFTFNVSSFSQEESIDSSVIDSEDYVYDEDYYEDDDTITEHTRSYLTEINFSFKNPISQMADKFGSNFYGFETSFFGQLKKSVPFYIGGSFFYDRYASNSISYFDFSQEDGNEYEFTESFGGNVIGVALGVKYFSKKSFWIFNPYIQFVVEFRRGYGVVNVTNVDIGETESTNFTGGNSSFGYDIGIGSLIAINSDEYFLNLRLSYNSGGGLFLYSLNEKSIAYNVLDYYDYKYVPIGFLSIKLGVTFL